ncbi:MAG: protein kinase domain-containing protein [Pyrinomonadaceae bacterium]
MYKTKGFPVAVKLPLDEQVDYEAVKREVRFWEQASGHPNILPILDADEYDGQVVIVSEYAPDGSLEQLLERDGSVPFEQAVQLTLQILNGLEYLHSQGIIHRDLKPANILLHGGVPRLADFGISRAMRTTSLSLNPELAPAYRNRARLYFDKKNYELAFDDCDRASKLKPDAEAAPPTSPSEATSLRFAGRHAPTDERT